MKIIINLNLKMKSKTCKSIISKENEINSESIFELSPQKQKNFDCWLKDQICEMKRKFESSFQYESYQKTLSIIQEEINESQFSKLENYNDKQHFMDISKNFSSDLKENESSYNKQLIKQISILDVKLKFDNKKNKEKIQKEEFLESSIKKKNFHQEKDFIYFLDNKNKDNNDLDEKVIKPKDLNNIKINFDHGKNPDQIERKSKKNLSELKVEIQRNFKKDTKEEDSIKEDENMKLCNYENRSKNEYKTSLSILQDKLNLLKKKNKISPKRFIKSSKKSENKSEKGNLIYRLKKSYSSDLFHNKLIKENLSKNQNRKKKKKTRQDDKLFSSFSRKASFQNFINQRHHSFLKNNITAKLLQKESESKTKKINHENQRKVFDNKFYFEKNTTKNAKSIIKKENETHEFNKTFFLTKDSNSSKLKKHFKSNMKLDTKKKGIFLKQLSKLKQDFKDKEINFTIFLLILIEINLIPKKFTYFYYKKFANEEITNIKLNFFSNFKMPTKLKLLKTQTSLLEDENEIFYELVLRLFLILSKGKLMLKSKKAFSLINFLLNKKDCSNYGKREILDNTDTFKLIMKLKEKIFIPKNEKKTNLDLQLTGVKKDKGKLNYIDIFSKYKKNEFISTKNISSQKVKKERIITLPSERILPRIIKIDTKSKSNKKLIVLKTLIK